MGKIKSMIKKCVVETAEHKRTCRRTGNAIPRGERCLVIFDGPRARHCYSRTIALEMVGASQAQLQGIVTDLS
jgi:hypothetical protein